MAIGTALGFSNLATIFLAIALAFVFGYSFTSWPLLRAGLALSAVVPIALASDTLSIATMEVVDNLIVLLVPARWTPASATCSSGARSACARDRGRMRVPGEPLADRAREGPCRRARDRHSRRPAGARRRGVAAVAALFGTAV